MPLTKLLNGSTSSCSPSGEKSLHRYFSITVFNFGSTLIRCAQAFSSRFSVVVSLASGAGDECATTREPPSVESGALVAWGFTRRGLSGDEEAVVDAINPTAEGVGVKGGGLMEESWGAVLRRLVVGVRGVTKTLVSVLVVVVVVVGSGAALALVVLGGLSAADSALLDGRPRFLLVV